jgi:putative addiction module killer protein
MSIEPPRIGLRKLRLANGKAPFEVWLASLVDVRLKQIVDARLTRLQAGNPGAIRNLGGGVWEIIIDFGPGIRIYFAFLGKEEVVLLGGGTKTTQERDIEKAKKSWGAFINENRRR